MRFPLTGHQIRNKIQFVAARFALAAVLLCRCAVQENLFWQAGGVSDRLINHSIIKRRCPVGGANQLEPVDQSFIE